VIQTASLKPMNSARVGGGLARLSKKKDAVRTGAAYGFAHFDRFILSIQRRQQHLDGAPT
jgi:hypothetical protein